MKGTRFTHVHVSVGVAVVVLLGGAMYYGTGHTGIGFTESSGRGRAGESPVVHKVVSDQRRNDPQRERKSRNKLARDFEKRLMESPANQMLGILQEAFGELGAEGEDVINLVRIAVSRSYKDLPAKDLVGICDSAPTGELRMKCYQCLLFHFADDLEKAAEIVEVIPKTEDNFNSRMQAIERFYNEWCLAPKRFDNDRFVGAIVEIREDVARRQLDSTNMELDTQYSRSMVGILNALNRLRRDMSENDRVEAIKMIGEWPVEQHHKDRYVNSLQNK